MYKLSATTRAQKGDKVRREGILPAVVYGGGQEAVSLSLSPRDFTKVFAEAGESSLIDLNIDNKPAGQVLVYVVDYDPARGHITHVDFKRVVADETIIATVELIFTGESPAVKELGGTLLRNIEEVDIECLPKDLIHDIQVDITALKTFDDMIKVADLPLPEGVKILDLGPEVVVAKVAPALTAEQIKAMEEAGQAGDVSKVEGVADKEKSEEAAGDKKETEKKSEAEKK